MAEEIQEAVQIIRVAYDGIEIAMKVGSGGIAAMQKAIDFLKGMLDYEKSLGKTSMRKLLLKGGDLQVLQFKTEDMRKVERMAKKYGILYSVLPDCNKTDGMKYSIKVNEVRAKDGSNIKGFATVVFGDSFKITNIAILENKEKGELFVSMPRYRSNERDEKNSVIYKDVCNPITAEFREELYTNILEAYAKIREPEKAETQTQGKTQEMPEFSVTVTPYEREGSNIKGLARIYFENSFIVNNVNILQGKEKIFVSMPSYKTKQVDEHGKPIYQDVCYPVTKDFREKLYNEIIAEYEKAKDKSNEKARENAEQNHGNPDRDKKDTPFR